MLQVEPYHETETQRVFGIHDSTGAFLVSRSTLGKRSECGL